MHPHTDPPKQEVTLRQGTVRYLDVGRGTPVLFVHGLLTNGLLWRKVVPSLSGAFRCLVPDWPLGSHAVPMAREADLSVTGMAGVVADFMEALDLREVVLVGNDTGGAICQLVAARHPDRIGRLVLTTCDAYEVFPPPRFAYLKVVGRIPLLPLVMLRALTWFPFLLRRPLAYGDLSRCRIPDEVLRAWVTPGARNRGVRRDLKKFLVSMSSVHTLQADEALRAFNRPALILWSPENRLFPVSLAHRLCAALPRARLELVREARVFVSEDQPGRVAEAIRRFAAGQGESHRSAADAG